jgi:DNA-directed RNA polymerase subunit RPC12/RpoP
MQAHRCPSCGRDVKDTDKEPPIARPRLAHPVAAILLAVAAALSVLLLVAQYVIGRDPFKYGFEDGATRISVLLVAAGFGLMFGALLAFGAALNSADGSDRAEPKRHCRSCGYRWME